MRFGLFGSAHSGAGFREFVENNVEAEALGYHSTSIEQIGERIAIFKAEVQAQGRVFDPMSVGVTRSINIVTTATDLERARENRVAGRRRIDRLATRPDGPGTNRAHLSDTEICGSALYGTPDEVAAMMQALRAVGAEYVLLNSAGGRPTLRRFARELMSAFSSAPAVVTASA